jgi:hypothetical protein
MWWGKSQSLTTGIHCPVIEARDLALTRRKNLPNAFIQLTAEGFHAKTKTIQRNRAPSWTESFIVCVLSVNLAPAIYFIKQPECS